MESQENLQHFEGSCSQSFSFLCASLFSGNGEEKTHPCFSFKTCSGIIYPQDELLFLYDYYEINEVNRRLHRLAKEFDAVLFEHLEEITSLGEGAKKDVLRMIEAVLEKEKEKKKND